MGRQAWELFAQIENKKDSKTGQRSKEGAQAGGMEVGRQAD
jgi:hypothetical protein